MNDEAPRHPWGFSANTEKPPVELSALAKECGVSEKEIREVLIKLGCAKPERKDVLRPRSGKPAIRKSTLTCLSVDAEQVRRYYKIENESPSVNENEKEVTQDNKPPKNWPSLGRLRIKLGLERSEIRSCLHEVTLSGLRSGLANTPFGALVQKSTSEMTVEYNGVTYISPEVAERLTELSTTIFRKRDGGKYLDASQAIQELGLADGKPEDANEKLKQEIDNFLQKYPWLSKEIVEKADIAGGPATIYYSRDLLSFIRKINESDNSFVTATEDVPEGYISERDIINSLELFPSKLEVLKKKVLTEVTLEKPIVGLFKPGSKAKKIEYFYSPELFKKISELKIFDESLREETLDESQGELIVFDVETETPEGYISKRECISILDITPEKFERLVMEVSQHHPEFSRPTVAIPRTNRSLRPRIFYSQELIKAISEFKTANEKDSPVEIKQEAIPEGYISLLDCTISLGISANKVQQLVDECLYLRPTLKQEGVINRRRGQSRGLSVFYSPELVSAITELKQKNDKLQREKIEDAQRILEETIKLKERLASVLDDISRGLPETAPFRRAVSLFGGARTIDLLKKFYPEFVEIPAQYMQKEVASYLSDYMVSRSENVIEDLDAAVPFLHEKVFSETLFTILKNNCAIYYSKKKRESRERTDQEILDEYYLILEQKAELLKSNELRVVVKGIEEYIQSLLNDFQKPEAIVDELNAGREFPDLNQIINIKEVADNRHVLIGDEMGMGKSGSAILSKEYLGVSTAIVIAPSNAIDMWKEYLSANVSPSGKQVGYFKPGKAPRVLEIQSVDDLSKARSQEYDYVLISHDRISEELATKLREVSYEMVIVDEAHKFKNITGGKRSNALLGMLEDCEDRDTYTVLLSGTPIPNKIRDMAIILKLLYPDRFGHMDNNLLVSSIIRGDLTDLRELLLLRTQMKKLSESIQMPKKEERLDFVTLSEGERELYQVVMEDDQMNSMERLSALRLFCLNPRKVFPDSKMVGSKITEAESSIATFFETKDKLVFFVNGYVYGVIRGENSVLSQMKMPEGVTVRIIDGDTSREERREIEQELKYTSNGKILLVVNGGAADVAVDFSAAEGVQFYNEPWTKFDKMQQTSRVYRPGLKHDIEVGTSVTRGSVEEGMHYYIEMKYRAVVKLLEGIPLSEMEKSLLLLDEKASDVVSVDKDFGFAEEWLQTPMGRLNRFSKMTKEIGEKEFVSRFLPEHGEAYASFYEELETHSFEANTARFVATLIEEYRKEKDLPVDITVLDLASGPEMLRKRMRTETNENVYSLDINPEHFKGRGGKQVVGGLTKLPFRDSSIDYVNLSHSLHYSSFRPEKGDYERLTVLAEISRVLKVGGRVTINLAHTQSFRSLERLGEIADEMGLTIINAKTGLVVSDNNYMSPCVTFEKVEEIDLSSTLTELKSRRRYTLYGLRLDTHRATKKLHSTQKIAKDFSIHGQTMETILNKEDMVLLSEQEEIQNEGDRLIKQYGGSVALIPKEEIQERGFLRYTSGNKSRLVKKGSHSKTFIYVN